MKFILLFLPIHLFFLFSTAAQNGESYHVTYRYKETSVNTREIDSLKTVYKDRLQEKVRVLTDEGEHESTLEKVLSTSGTFKLDMPFYMIATKDSARMYFFNSGRQNRSKIDEMPPVDNIDVNIIMPDTLFYKNGHWTSLKNGSLTKMETKPNTFCSTTETKVIQGYHCIKYVQNDTLGNEQIIVWASNDLPNTLLPYAGIETFHGGILEFEHKTNNVNISVTKIKRLP